MRYLKFLLLAVCLSFPMAGFAQEVTTTAVAKYNPKKTLRTEEIKLVAKIPNEQPLKYRLNWSYIERNDSNAALKYNSAKIAFEALKSQKLRRLAAGLEWQFEVVLDNPEVFAEKKKEREQFEAGLKKFADNSGKLNDERQKKTIAYKVDEYQYICSLKKDEFPMDRAQEFVSEFGWAYRNLEEASKCENCDWERRIRGQGSNVYFLLLPEIQGFRDFSSALQLKAKYEIYSGDFKAAIGTIKVGMCMARHLGSDTVLISQFVGIAIQNSMYELLLELVQQPNAPNLYWAITDLPKNSFDLRKCFEAEADLLMIAIPELAKAVVETESMTAEDWKNIWNAVDRFSDDLGYKSPKLAEWLGKSGIIDYPWARRHLIESGFSAEAVDAMSVHEVLSRIGVKNYRRYREEVLKIVELPYWQMQNYKGVKYGGNGPPSVWGLDQIVRDFVPMLGMAGGTFARCEQQREILRIIEAIRIHAAENNGKLPAKLAEITAVPITDLDPFSGRAFDYHIENNKAVITCEDNNYIYRTVVEIAGE